MHFPRLVAVGPLLVLVLVACAPLHTTLAMYGMSPSGADSGGSLHSHRKAPSMPRGGSADNLRRVSATNSGSSGALPRGESADTLAGTPPSTATTGWPVRTSRSGRTVFRADPHSGAVTVGSGADASGSAQSLHRESFDRAALSPSIEDLNAMTARMSMEDMSRLDRGEPVTFVESPNAREATERQAQRIPSTLLFPSQAERRLAAAGYLVDDDVAAGIVHVDRVLRRRLNDHGPPAILHGTNGPVVEHPAEHGHHGAGDPHGNAPGLGYSASSPHLVEAKVDQVPSALPPVYETLHNEESIAAALAEIAGYNADARKDADMMMGDAGQFDYSSGSDAEGRIINDPAHFNQLLMSIRAVLRRVRFLKEEHHGRGALSSTADDLSEESEHDAGILAAMNDIVRLHPTLNDLKLAFDHVSTEFSWDTLTKTKQMLSTTLAYHHFVHALSIHDAFVSLHMWQLNLHVPSVTLAMASVSLAQHLLSNAMLLLDSTSSTRAVIRFVGRHICRGNYGLYKKFLRMGGRARDPASLEVAEGMTTTIISVDDAATTPMNIYQMSVDLLNGAGGMFTVLDKAVPSVRQTIADHRTPVTIILTSIGMTLQMASAPADARTDEYSVVVGLTVRAVDLIEQLRNAIM